MTRRSETRRAGFFDLARRAIEFWALVGGLLLLAIVLMNAYSLVSDILFRRPLPGDFELVEVGVAVAAFAFLPYCQITGANVTADIFTQNVGPRMIAFLALNSALIAFAFSLLLTWRMSLGLLDFLKYRETTAIMQFPIWAAYIPILMSLVMLALASLISVREALEGVRSAKGDAAADA